jgi:hypothetical protein
MKQIPVKAFTDSEAQRAKHLLATRVTTMMGRKMEEGDWSSVYCAAKGIPEAGWSNLHIDVSYQGLGLELKLLCKSGQDSIKSVCGTTQMHPAATRSIRIPDVGADPNAVMLDVFKQYAELIGARATRVQQDAGGKPPDMRIGWLLWEPSLVEFLYFEQKMLVPIAAHYYAEWNDSLARGSRKGSRSLWIFERATNKKRYSVTTSAGIKIQPYFDVPPPNDENVFYFRVQGEPAPDDPSTTFLWISANTAAALRARLGDLDKLSVTKAVNEALALASDTADVEPEESDLAQSVPIATEVYQQWRQAWSAARSDEHRAQLLLKALG